MGKKYDHEVTEYQDVVNGSGVTDVKGLITKNLTSGFWLFQTIHVRGGYIQEPIFSSSYLI